MRLSLQISLLVALGVGGCATDVSGTVEGSVSAIERSGDAIVSISSNTVVSLDAIGAYESSCSELMGPDLEFYEVEHSPGLVACVDPSGTVVCVDTVEGVVLALEELGDALLADFPGLDASTENSFYDDGDSSRSEAKREEPTSELEGDEEEGGLSGADPSPQPSSASSGDPSPQPSNSASDDPSPQPSNTASDDPSPQPSSTASGDPSPQPSSTASGDPSPQPSNSASDDPSPQPSATASGE